MWRRYIFSFLFQLILIISFAAGEIRITGTRSAGMGFCSAALSDNWSAFNNQAGLAWQKNLSAGLCGENRFLLKELSTENAGINIPFRGGTFGVTFQNWGYSLYSEMNAGIAFARTFGKHFAGGIRLYYLKIHIDGDYGTRHLGSFEIGFQYRADEKWMIGIHFSNPVPVRVHRYQDEHLPIVIRLGISYQPSGKFLATLEAEKDLAMKPCIRAGIEYHFAKPAFLRIGIMTNPVEFTFGLGLETSRLTIGISSAYHLYLGFSPQASIVYSFK